MTTMLNKYRFLIKHLPKYPSRSRDRLLILVREDFRANRNETNPKKLQLFQSEVDAGKFSIQPICMMIRGHL
ncbi:hypothetical protein PPL_03804 [Heterostelium album PN500]|uniref:Complex 1 LYR protein domain-containing protein n=1 Tax=Heterostelium pallidum (strain ATCC 26659 / Pp 5 / PN500) TaxID=670386 RepID=D3B6Q1_HETP5|nr:hypothetical protein PPL_03804 [Heterostelium album PN500]EFA83021.1 hypothetical protein PPL_03804 [Heterostelium album PN500]|eukprot:XP_020435138.1 hypothetical protein PPL_03804 [Heterostelium album PN500]